MKRSVLGPRGRMGAPVPKPHNTSTIPPNKRTPEQEEIARNGKPGLRSRTIQSMAPNSQKPPTARVGVPDAARAAKGLSLLGLLKRQPRYQLNSAEDVVVKALKHTSTKGGMAAITGVTRDLKTKPQRLHKFSVIGLNPAASKIASQKRIKVSCDCVTGDTRVLTSQGWKTIFDIAEEFNPNVLPFEYVINGKLHKGTAPYFKGKQPVWKITASNGREIKATADHKFLVYESYTGTKRVWRKLKNLKPGDRIHVDSFDAPAVDTRSQAYLEGFFLGVIQGDGSVNGNYSADLHLCGRKTALLEILAEAGVVHSAAEGRGSTRVTFNHRAIELLRRHKFRNKLDVEITDPQMMLGYIGGLISTDGTITKTLTVTGDRSYLSQAQEMCQQLGMGMTTLHRSASRGNTTNYATRSKDLYALRFSSQDIPKLCGRLRLAEYNEKRFENLLARLGNKTTRSAATITDIVYAGRQNVYDITVPGPTRFNANGFTVHNCEFFLYYSEYALWTWGAANIIYSNGQPAHVRNPGNHPILCKHLVQVLNTIYKNNF